MYKEMRTYQDGGFDVYFEKSDWAHMLIIIKHFIFNY